MSSVALSEQLRSAFDSAGEDFTIGDLLDRVEGKGYGLLLTISPLPTALPFTPPGFTLPFGLLQVVLAAQMLVGRPTPWLPKGVLNRKVTSKGGNPKKMWAAMPGFMSKFERMLRPRMGFLYQGIGPNLLAISVMLASIAMMVPFPVTNSICAIGVFMVGLGYLEEDGLFGLVGAVVCILSFLIVAALIVGPIWFGMKGLRMEKMW